MNLLEEKERQKNDLLKKYDRIKESKEEINYEQIELDKKRDALQVNLSNYRKESVMRVLEFIAYNSERLTPRTIQLLTVHCMNKLHGNIDGIELTLEFDKEETKNDKAGTFTSDP